MFTAACFGMGTPRRHHFGAQALVFLPATAEEVLVPDLWGVLSPAASLCFCCTPWRPLDRVLVHRLVSFEVMAILDT